MFYKLTHHSLIHNETDEFNLVAEKALPFPKAEKELIPLRNWSLIKSHITTTDNVFS